MIMRNIFLLQSVKQNTWCVKSFEKSAAATKGSEGRTKTGGIVGGVGEGPEDRILSIRYCL